MTAMPSSVLPRCTQSGSVTILRSLFCRNMMSLVTSVPALSLKAVLGRRIAPSSSARSARYFLTEGFALSSVPLLVINATMPPGTDVAERAAEEENTEDIIEADPDVKNYTYTFVDGKLYYRENSVMYRKEVSATAEERIKGMDEIRTITRQLIFIQTEGCSSEELAAQQKLLNDRYDRCNSSRRDQPR